MPELRKDPIIGRWVIIARERAKRPTDFISEQEEISPKFCPFCLGNEDKTPEEVLAYRRHGGTGNQPDWWLRVVPNKYPALVREGDLGRVGEGMYDKMNGVGAHEVVIETPNHALSFGEYETNQVEEIIWAYRDRMIELKKDTRLRYIMIFKNHKKEAGASLDHPHSQIIALPIIPKRVKEELDGSKEYYDFKERCVYCDIVRQEQELKKRVIDENDDFIAVAPFASRFPFETWIVPKQHGPHFSEIQKHEVANFADILKEVLLRIKEVLNNPPYNFMLHTAPCNDPIQANWNYHWHLEITPKLTKVAGFEWGTGFYINPVPPEDAAMHLRNHQEEMEEEINPAVIQLHGAI